MHSRKSFAFILLVLALVSMPAAAQADDPTHPCASVVEPVERLVCYDKAFPPAAGVQAGNVDLEARRQEALEEFGLNKQQLFDRQPEELREIQPDRIEGVVKGVAERADGGRVVTLENDQVWLLTEGRSRGRLETGDKVTIREAALSSYMLFTPAGIPLRAKRLR